MWLVERQIVVSKVAGGLVIGCSLASLLACWPDFANRPQSRGNYCCYWSLLLLLVVDYFPLDCLFNC